MVSCRLGYNNAMCLCLQIPPDSVQLVLSQNEAPVLDESDFMNSEQLPQRVAAAVREYLCHKAYLVKSCLFCYYFFFTLDFFFLNSLRLIKACQFIVDHRKFVKMLNV